MTLLIERTDNIFGSILIRYRMLADPLRQFVIKLVKDPLHATIENESQRLIRKTGAVSKDNPIYGRSRSLIDLRDWFTSMEDNPGRAPMFESAFNLAIAKLEGVDFGIEGFLSDQATILASKLLRSTVGECTKQNTIHPHTYLLLDLRDWDMGFTDNSGQQELSLASWDILIYEVEHDPYYGFRFNRILKRVTDKVNSGEWVFGDYSSVYGIRFNRILRQIVSMVNSGEWKFEPLKPSDSFCWREKWD